MYYGKGLRYNKMAWRFKQTSHKWNKQYIF